MPNKRFPTTRQSAVEALKSSDKDGRTRAYHTILDCYWKPAYKYIRVRWQESPEDAEDLTQGFFAVAFEKRYLERYDPSQARFSAFLRSLLIVTLPINTNTRPDIKIRSDKRRPSRFRTC